MLELLRLRRRFGRVTALDGLTFSVPPGIVFGFLGPNGAGKTTAMRAVMGITSLDAGRVRWGGRTIGAEDRRGFGYMPEERGLYPAMRVGEQVEYFARLHGMTKPMARGSAASWLEALGLGERARDKVESLSQGNQQRVQIAATLVHDPALLLLDEPFAGLDPVGIDSLAGVLSDRARAGATVVFSSHQLDLVEHLCEQVAIIDAGRLVAAGRVADLTAPDGKRITLEVAGAGSDWHRRLRGVRVAEVASGRLSVELHDGGDPKRLLAAAARAGEVRHFSFERRRLSEVFLDAVRRE